MYLQDAKQMLRQAEEYLKGANHEIQSISPLSTTDDWTIMCKPCFVYRLKHAKDIIDLLLEEHG